MIAYKSDKVIGQSLLLHGSFQERQIKEVNQFLIRSFGFQPTTFLDIGANIGTHVIHAVQTGQFSLGIAIEPDFNNFNLLRCNILLNQAEEKIRPFRIALSDNSEPIILELSPGNFGDHRIRTKTDHLSPSIDDEQMRETSTVPSATLDDFLEAQQPDLATTLIWMDTQGHEGHIMSSGKKALANGACYIVSEFWPYGLERSGGKRNLFDFLGSCHYIYDTRCDSWEDNVPLTLEQLESLYQEMLADTRKDYHPHTDLLLIRQSTPK
ncbi:FkbM family methyltransferase [Synechococcus sp. CS-1324]|uniref:FkbM family methyltransferase n=1 Tax=Synechococcus sp. CS-1324 TaxID=2847980 RepID=UPI00223AA13F|nr:FkbM family methyltransferase [Synechococcus sp. CS-1324]